MFLPTVDRALTLTDGRCLCYTVYGQPEGHPLLALEPLGLQLIGRFGQWSARRTGTQVITPYRPGFGFSDSNPEATLIDWADDLRQLLDALHLPVVAVVGIFTGSAAALAAASELPERIASVALLNPAGPPHTEPSTLQTFLAGPYRDRLAKALGPRSSTRLFERVARSLPPSDRSILLDRAIRPVITEACRHAAAHTAAVRAELVRSAAPWPFQLETITAPVAIWHGTADSMHPMAGGTALAQQLPNARLIPLHNHGALWFLDPTDGITQVPA